MDRPFCIVVGALGGEGGGVLANWLVDAAEHAGFVVQQTSVPGVAQRTGATTYYLEIHPNRHVEAPVLALLPSPGSVDLVVASELLEAGRAAQNGMVTPNRTTVIASTHRFYAIAEKSAMGDGRFETDRIIETVREMAEQSILVDLKAVAEENGTVISSVLFGAMAAAGRLPMDIDHLRGAIERSGIMVAVNLRGFEAGMSMADAHLEYPTGGESVASPMPSTIPLHPTSGPFPAAVKPVVDVGVSRASEYQDKAYADLFVDRVRRIYAAESESAPSHFSITIEAARHLALWMTYEDIIRVADLKSRKERLDEVRRDVRASDGQPIVIVEYLKPGLDEWCSVLPPRLSGWFRRTAERLGIVDRLSVGLHVKSTSVTGFLMLRGLAKLRGVRRHTSRFVEEQLLIEGWLDRLCALIPNDSALALEVAQCPTLLKGYGDTHRRGIQNFNRVMAEIGQCAQSSKGAELLGEMRSAALADPEGQALTEIISRSRALPT
ncbi:MAG: indolepyruvate oxidoreductase subunit beta family protein [Pseudomonadota bacterium]